jgi:hypothetical protein
LNLRFGLGAGARDFVGERHRRSFFSSAASFLGGAFLVFASGALGFFANAIDLALQLLVCVLTNPCEFSSETRLGLGLDACDFFGGGASCCLFCRGPGFLQLALAHRRSFRLDAGHVFGLCLLGGFLRAAQFFGERFIRAGAHASHFVGELLLGLVAHLTKLGAQRFLRGSFGGGTSLGDCSFSLRSGFGFDASHFGRALLGSFGSHALELGGHLCGGFTLRGSLGFDARHFGRTLLRGFCAHALDLGGHLRSRFTLGSGFGFDARHFSGALLGSLGADALHFRRHLGSGLCLHERDFRGVHFGIDGVFRRELLA